MKTKTLIVLSFAFGLSSPSYGFGGVASETTQIANNLLMGAQLAEQAAIYAKQIQEYKTQLEQYDLQKIAAEVFDTGQFDSTLEKLDEYKDAFNLDDSKAKLGELQDFSDLLATGGEFDAQEYLGRLGEATNRKLELSNAQSDLVTRRMESVEADREALERMQDANANAEGEMQATQIGNHINSEVAAQILKMRMEQAAEAQARLEKEGLDEALQALEAARIQQDLDRNTKATEEIMGRDKYDGSFRR